MLDVVVPIAVFGIMFMIVVQVRQLFSHAILNRTIRKAIEASSDSLPLLIAKLEPRPHYPNGLVGWIMVVAGVAIGAGSLCGPASDREDGLQVAAITIVIGCGVLAYAWWVERTTPRP